MSEQSLIKLNDGNMIPQYGIGVFMIPDGEQTVNAVKTALQLGVRHIDTAHAYQNERSVGKAVKDSGINRHDIWITSKLWVSDYGKDITTKAINKMLNRLDTDYIDLLLLHQQVGEYLDAWKEAEQAVKLGKVRSIGISNFESERLEELCNFASIKPSVNQVELHPYFQQNELKKRLKKYGTLLESWYPIGHGSKELINEPLFTELGEKYHKSNVQIILRWHLQEGNIIFPKSTNPQHIKDNFDIFDFCLSNEEMQKIRGLDKGVRFYNATLSQQEAMFKNYRPADD
ncbi:MAG: aldo/keto reductase [Ruminococcus sp.]|jgi:diketogulonate reductase-like aldo/keto reductase|nr:aldo/keto reductase [Ruminococcus sp.]